MSAFLNPRRSPRPQPLDRALRSSLARGLNCALLGLLLTASVEGIAHAQSADAEAQALASDAIFEDYLRLDFKKAARKLRRALQLCKKSGCSPTIEAQILRDLAVVYVTGQNRKTRGRELLVQALKLDSRIALDSDLTTPELVKVFREAQQSVLPDAPETTAAEPGTGSGTEGSEDCPPDFPGCEELSKADPAAADNEEPEDINQWVTGTSHWVSVSVQQDTLWLSGESGVCLANAPDELSCYRAGGAYREPVLTEGDGGAIEGGFRFATTRLLLGYERDLFLPGLRLGALVGYALGGGPAEPEGADFLPIHVELRGRYSFTPAPFGLPVTPFASLALGVAQVDTTIITEVIDRNPNPTTNEALIVRSKVNVWKKTGTTFASLGGGASYPLGDVGSVSAQARLMFLFPSSGAALSFQLGYTHGF